MSLVLYNIIVFFHLSNLIHFFLVFFVLVLFAFMSRYKVYILMTFFIM